MTKTTEHEAAAAATDGTRKGRHRFVINAGRDLAEFELEADDFEVAPEGIHFLLHQGMTTEHVAAFVSHPCVVRMDDAGLIAVARGDA